MAILGKVVEPVAKTPVAGPGNLNIKPQVLRSPVVKNSAITKPGYMEATPSVVNGMRGLTKSQTKTFLK